MHAYTTSLVWPFPMSTVFRERQLGNSSAGKHDTNGLFHNSLMTSAQVSLGPAIGLCEEACTRNTQRLRPTRKTELFFGLFSFSFLCLTVHARAPGPPKRGRWPSSDSRSKKKTRVEHAAVPGDPKETWTEARQPEIGGEVRWGGVCWIKAGRPSEFHSKTSAEA